MMYDEKREAISEGLADELFKLLDSAGFKLIETRTGEDGEATFGSQQIISDALAGVVDPFLRKAFELGAGNDKDPEDEGAHQEDERVRRPVKFIDTVPPAPASPARRSIASDRMLDEGGASEFLPIFFRDSSAHHVCKIKVTDLAEIAGQAADDFIVGHLRSKGFNMSEDIYRERGDGIMICRQRRR